VDALNKKDRREFIVTMVIVGLMVLIAGIFMYSSGVVDPKEKAIAEYNADMMCYANGYFAGHDILIRQAKGNYTFTCMKTDVTVYFDGKGGMVSVIR